MNPEKEVLKNWIISEHVKLSCQCISLQYLNELTLLSVIAICDPKASSFCAQRDLPSTNYTSDEDIYELPCKPVLLLTSKVA